MKTKKLFILKAIAVLVMLFSASLIKAQAPQVAPYPDVDDKQSLTIDQTSTLWQPLMDASSNQRSTAQKYLNANPGSTSVPASFYSCVGSVCCQTDAIWCPDHNCWHFLTQCTHNGQRLDLIQQ